MKISLIPPIPNLEYYLPKAKVHLALAQHLEHRAARDAYRARADAGDLVILDNGAHESVSTAMVDLLALGKVIGAREIVLPDVSLDTGATIEATRDAWSWLKTKDGQKAYADAGRPNLMVVPQGRTAELWARCLASQLAHSTGFKPVTVGLAKNHDDVLPGGHYDLLKHLENNPTDRIGDLHMLGWPTDLFTLQDVARDFGNVRSVDSAKPFVYAEAGIKITPMAPMPEYPKRQPEYFQTPLSDGELVEHNIAQFELFATGRA